MTKVFCGKDSIQNAMWHRYKHNQDVMVILDEKGQETQSSTALNLMEKMNKALNKE